MNKTRWTSGDLSDSDIKKQHSDESVDYVCWNEGYKNTGNLENIQGDVFKSR
jgi:hypothetical protein